MLGKIDDLQFLQLTSYKHSALKNVMLYNCFEVSASLSICYVFVILRSRDVVSLLKSPIGFLRCCNLIHHFLLNS